MKEVVYLMFRFALFDFDMTLADSSYAITETTNLMAERAGLPSVTREQLLSVIGLPIRESWFRLWGRFEEQWLTEYRNIFRDREYEGIVLFPRTLEVLDALKGRGVVLGVASNRQDPAPVLKATELSGYFAAAVGMDDVENPKPAPDMVLRGVELLGGTAESCLFVGDTTADMESARNASVRAAGLTTGNCSPESLRDAGASWVFHDIGHVLSLFPD